VTNDRNASRRSWGAHFIGPETVRFRLWAPGEDRVTLRLDEREIAMDQARDGWFERVVANARPGSRYSYVLSDGFVVPDPAAKAQSGDVHGPSLLVDPASYTWANPDWIGRSWEEAVIYELHLGTFTSEGTFDAARQKLPYLADLGITAVELMPVAQFSGNRGWGYDGVLLYAPHNAYGSPDDFKAFVDAAHGLQMMVLLDVVYNHFGPEGNYLPRYAPHFFHPERHTPWGAAIAYERRPVRRFFIENALYWLQEYKLDGLRLDAIDHVRDERSEPEILVEIAQTRSARRSRVGIST
jgi:maltooligosyltrehalose trehalohydrolase